jgi:hypothetical protein
MLCLLGSPLVTPAQTTAGVYFAFQTGKNDPGTSSATFTTTPSLNTFLGTPVFSRTGSATTSYQNFGGNFTAFDGSLWFPGRCLGLGNASTNNSWQVTLNTTSVTGLVARFKYRLNNATSGGSPVTKLSGFDYKIGTGAFQAVTNALPGVSLTLANNTSFENIWTANLLGLAAIENQPSETLRWKLPDLDGSCNVRADANHGKLASEPHGRSKIIALSSRPLP